jgi:hypothetical protein
MLVVWRRRREKLADVNAANWGSRQNVGSIGKGASAHTVKRAIRTDLTSAHTAVHTRRAGVDPGCEGDVSPDDRNDEAEAAGEVRWLCLRWWVASPAGAFGGVG